MLGVILDTSVSLIPHLQPITMRQAITAVCLWLLLSPGPLPAQVTSPRDRAQSSGPSHQ